MSANGVRKDARLSIPYSGRSEHVAIGKRNERGRELFCQKCAYADFHHSRVAEELTAVSPNASLSTEFIDSICEEDKPE